MSTEFITLLDISTTGSFVSDKQPGAAYHSKVANVHTFISEFDSFVGTVQLQGTLEIFPGDNDWFVLRNINNADVVYTDTDTGTITTASRGNFLWVRAVGSVASGTVRIRFAC